MAKSALKISYEKCFGTPNKDYSLFYKVKSEEMSTA